MRLYHGRMAIICAYSEHTWDTLGSSTTVESSSKSYTVYKSKVTGGTPRLGQFVGRGPAIRHLGLVGLREGVDELDVFIQRGCVRGGGVHPACGEGEILVKHFRAVVAVQDAHEAAPIQVVRHAPSVVDLARDVQQGWPRDVAGLIQKHLSSARRGAVEGRHGGEGGETAFKSRQRVARKCRKAVLQRHGYGQ